MRCITIINQKGGCGKTTTSINLAGIFARLGLRTLLVDMDPQSHCAAGLAIPEQRIDLDIGDAMLAPDLGAMDWSRVLWRVSRNFDLAPSRMRLAGLEASRGGLADRPDKERRLSAVLNALAPNYDIACVDCSPAIGLLAFNAITAASEIIIPVETSYFSLQGATKQVNTVRSVERRLGAKAPAWLLATMHDESSALAVDLLNELRRRFGNRVIPVVIHLDGALKESASFGQPVAEYAPQSLAAAQYLSLARWLLDRSGIELASLTEAPEGLGEIHIVPRGGTPAAAPSPHPIDPTDLSAHDAADAITHDEASWLEGGPGSSVSETERGGSRADFAGPQNEPKGILDGAHARPIGEDAKSPFGENRMLHGSAADLAGRPRSSDDA